jgi:hypothetical protein
MASPSDTGLDLSGYLEAAKVPLEPREPEPLWLDRLTHISPSSIAQAHGCLEHWRRRYICGEKVPPGEAALIGSTMHITLEHNYRQKIDSHEDRPLAEVMEYLEDEALPRKLEQEGGEGEIQWTTNLGTARETARRCTSAYYSLVVPRIQPIAVEQRVEVHARQLPIKMIGYVDTETGLRVIDTKTVSQAAKKIKPGWHLQGTFYAIAQRKQAEFHTISRAKTPTIYTPAELGDDLVVYPPDDAEHFFDQVGHMAQIIEWCYLKFGPDEPWPTTGAIGHWTQTKLPCDFCGWRSTCPAWA